MWNLFFSNYLKLLNTNYSLNGSYPFDINNLSKLINLRMGFVLWQTHIVWGDGKARESISCGVSPRTWLVQYYFIAIFIISIAHTLLFDFQLQEWTYHYQHILFLFMKLLFYHLSSFSWNGCLDAFYLLVGPSNEMFPFVFNLIMVNIFLCLAIFFQGLLPHLPEK